MALEPQDISAHGAAKISLGFVYDDPASGLIFMKCDDPSNSEKGCAWLLPEHARAIARWLIENADKCDQM